MIKFSVPGNPQGKARARTGKGFAYTPEKTVNYEALVKMLAKQATKEYYPVEALTLGVVAYYEIPKSASKKKRAEMLRGEIRPTKKPDIDNICKIIADALNGICYKDDSQIVDVYLNKHYSDIPRVDVEIKIS